jgi:hypothetical protein
MNICPCLCALHRVSKKQVRINTQTYSNFGSFKRSSKGAWSQKVLFFFKILKFQEFVLDLLLQQKAKEPSNQQPRTTRKGVCFNLITRESSRVRFHKTSLSSLLINGFNKLECWSVAILYYPSIMKHCNALTPFVCYKENQVLWIWSQDPFFEQFIFFVNYKWPW